MMIDINRKLFDKIIKDKGNPKEIYINFNNNFSQFCHLFEDVFEPSLLIEDVFSGNLGYVYDIKTTDKNIKTNKIELRY